jgi:hypothetical protein
MRATRTTIGCRSQDLESIFVFASKIYEVRSHLAPITDFCANHSCCSLKRDEEVVSEHIYDGVVLFASMLRCLAFVLGSEIGPRAAICELSM